MAGITIVDESKSIIWGLRNHWGHWNSTRIWTKAGNLGVSYTDLCFLVFVALLVGSFPLS